MIILLNPSYLVAAVPHLHTSLPEWSIRVGGQDLISREYAKRPLSSPQVSELNLTELPLHDLTSLNSLHSLEFSSIPPILCSGVAAVASRPGKMMSRTVLRQSGRVAGAIGGRIAASVRARTPPNTLDKASEVPFSGSQSSPRSRTSLLVLLESSLLPCQRSTY